MLFVSLVAFALATIMVSGGLLQHSWKINTGNTNSTVSGKSTCVAHNLTVAATSNNFKLLFPEPANQVAATESVVELLQTNSSSFARANDGQKIITGNYNIYGQFCFSSDSEAAKHVQTIQFLTHGDTLDSTYWDIAPGYSYIDAAIGAGYATFSYDRIGVGKSDHPDPIQIVQGPLQVEIAHALVTLIRSTQIEKQSFKNVVGVGHSAGSTVTQGVTTKYPQDFDAVILTGTSISANYVTAALASFDLTIANTDASGRFAGLSNGYLVQPIQQSIQFPYYRFPNFDPKNLAVGVANKQTQTFGELLTLGSIIAPSTLFTGPVDVVLGENDLVFCGGDCTKPQDQSAMVAPVFYPAAKTSQHYLVPGAGHVIFAHYSVQKAFDQMTAFLQANGL